MTVGRGVGAGEGCKGSESSGSSKGGGGARELMPGGRMTAFLL